MCGAPITVDLAAIPEDEREIHRLNCSITLEDQYTDRVAHAFKVWWLYYMEIKPGGASGVKESRNDDSDPAARALRRLREEESELFGRKKGRLEAEYGNDNFPDLRALVKSTADGVRSRRQVHLQAPGVKKLVEDELRCSIRAELEKVIWGRVRSDTASAVEALKQKIGRLVEDERARREAADEEEARRKGAEEEGEARLKKEAEEGETDEKPEGRARHPPVDVDMSGLRGFDFEVYERQTAGGDRPSGQVSPRRARS